MLHIQGNFFQKQKETRLAASVIAVAISCPFYPHGATSFAIICAQKDFSLQRYALFVQPERTNEIIFLLFLNILQ